MTTQPHYTEYDTRLAAYAVIVRSVDGTDEVLLALWNEASERRWTLPGGGIDLHERIEDGVVREVREETGYDVELVDLVGVDTYVFDAQQRLARSIEGGRPLKAVRVIYTARVVGGELTPEEDGTTDEARWFPLVEVASLPRVSTVDIGLRMAGR